jgi:2,5-furandicarboxylate decarboxylase 1
MAANHLGDLTTIIEDLDSAGRIAHVTSEVELDLHLAGVAAQLEGQPNAVMFHNVAGHEAPVFTGLYWSRDLLAHLLRQPERELPQYVSGCIEQWQRAPVDPVVVDDGPVLQGQSGLSLSDLPIPVHAQKDGGPYFDAGVVIATDPETGVRNASIQRFMVVDDRTLHVNIDAGRHLGLYLEKAREQNKSLFISINCGVGPGLHFAAATPAEAAPPDTDELGIASVFQDAPLELVRGKMTPTELVANAMYSIECEMIPGEVGDEGPFAEVTGYYARREPRPVVRVRAIHARPNPVFQTILSGAEVWNSVGLLGEANVLATLKRQIPGVQDVYFTHGGCGFYHAVVSLAQKRAGWGKQAIMATFAAFPPLKMVTVVDDDVNIRDASDVEWAMATRLDAKAGIVTIDKVFGHGLNPGFPDYLGTKVGFDCTRPYPHSYEYDRAAYRHVSLDDVEITHSLSRAGTSSAVAMDAASDSLAGAGNTSSLTQADVTPSTAGSVLNAVSVKPHAASQTGVLVMLTGREGKKKHQQRALDLFIDLQERTVSSELPFAFERARTAAEFVATLNAYRGRFTQLVMLSGKKRSGFHFADELSESDGAALGKLISSTCEQQSLQVILPGRLDAMQRFARDLSKGSAITEVVAIDRRQSPEWTASLLDGFLRCLSVEERVEVALKDAMPPAAMTDAGIWRDGKAFTHIEQ